MLLAILSECVVWASSDLKLNSVVIDAGHGGKDPGAVSTDRKSYEKDFTLDISKKLAEKIKTGCPDVEVALTRSNDNFVSLDDRAVKANRVGAKLFISVHINASKNTDANGYSVHVLGQSKVKNRDLFAYNMNVCQRENSVILLEDDYTTKYQGFNPNDQESYIFMTLMQNSNLEQSLTFAQVVSDEMSGGPIVSARGVWQNPFYVLWKTSMPAVLLELGFISNKDDLQVLLTRRDEIVDRLYSAFIKYKSIYEGIVPVQVKEQLQQTSQEQKKDIKLSEPAAEPLPLPVIDTVSKAHQITENKKNTIKYGVQIFALKALLFPNDKQFMGYTPEIIDTGEIYKYVIGVTDNLEEAKENYLIIKQRYVNCFIIKIENGVISRL